MLDVVLVRLGEEREPVLHRDNNGTFTSITSKNHRGFVDLSFNGSKPVRVYMPIEQYEQTILTQLPPPPQGSPYLNYIVR